MRLLKSLCSPNSTVEDLNMRNGMVITDINNDGGEEKIVEVVCTIADLDRCHHLNCLRAKGVCRTLSRALAGALYSMVTWASTMSL